MLLSDRPQIGISTEDFYQDFLARAVPADVHGILMRVGCVEDTLRGKLKAFQDLERRPSKRRKDLLDLTRMGQGATAKYAKHASGRARHSVRAAGG